jgi:O-antigen/teichoic acid export membrane protein
MRHHSLAKVARAGAWGLADQALSSLTNFALNLFAARSLPLAEFGAFALLFSAYLIVLGVSRALGSEVLVVRFSGRQDGRHEAMRASLGVALSVGCAAGLLAVVAAAAMSGPLRAALLVLAVCLPALLIQDAWRFLLFAEGRPAAAAFNDLVWAVVLAVTLPLAVRRGADAAALMGAWGMAAAAAAVVGFLQARVFPAPAAVRGWLFQHGDLAGRYLLEFAAIALTQASWVLVAAVAGSAVVGAVRAAQLLFGPVNVLLMGANLAGVPEAARAATRTPSEAVYVGRWIAAGATAGVVLWGVALLVVPQDWISLLFRDATTAARALYLPTFVAMALLPLITGANVVIRGLAAASRGLRARWLQSVLLTVGLVLGAALGGAQGGAWALACALGVATVVWWVAAVSAARAATVPVPIAGS